MKVDMRYVCPKDVKKKLLKQARSTYWKKWEPKHEYEELNWLKSSGFATWIRRKIQVKSIVARKLVLEGGWVQKKLFHIGWCESECQTCHKEKGT